MKQTEHLRAERDVLRLMQFPFVVQLLTCFQDEECVYFVMEYSCGGEFFRHLKARGRYTRSTGTSLCVLLAAQYVPCVMYCTQPKRLAKGGLQTHALQSLGTPKCQYTLPSFSKHG